MSPNLQNRSKPYAANMESSQSPARQEPGDIFNRSTTKRPLALWGLGHLVSDATVSWCTKWAIEPSGADAKTRGGQIEREVASMTHRLSVTDGVPGLDDIVLGLSASQAMASQAMASESTFVFSPDLVEQLKSLAKLARDNDAIEYLLHRSLGIEIGLWLADRRFELEPREAAEPSHGKELAEQFESIIEENLDTDGWPDSRLLKQIEALAACWARSFQLLNRCDVDILGGVQVQLEWFARQCLRLRLKDGTMIFGQAGSDWIDERFWDAVTSMSKDPHDVLIANMFSGDLTVTEAVNSKRKKITPAMAKKLVDPHNVSEWAGSFLLRSNWRTKSPRVAVDFSNAESSSFSESNTDSVVDVQRCFTEIARSRKLVSGQTLPEIQIDGNLAAFEGGFDVVCNVHDDDLDYVEMQTRLSHGGRLNRQWLLSRSDQFLVVADSVLPTNASEIDYRCLWPLAAGVTTMAETETSEVYLQDADTKKIESLVLPLGLPEWKAERFDGSLVANDDSLVLEQQAHGQALFAALVFDLKPGRSRKKRTWRKLTVAQNRQPVAGDQGVAFRFQLNNRQWFFYRSLASTGNRTFLGQNVVSEFAFYRFHANGTATSLIEVD